MYGNWYDGMMCEVWPAFEGFFFQNQSAVGNVIQLNKKISLSTRIMQECANHIYMQSVICNL